MSNDKSGFQKYALNRAIFVSYVDDWESKVKLCSHKMEDPIELKFSELV